MENKIYMTNIPVACQVSIPSNSINEKVLLQRSDLAYSINIYFKNREVNDDNVTTFRNNIRLDSNVTDEDKAFVTVTNIKDIISVHSNFKIIDGHLEKDDDVEINYEEIKSKEDHEQNMLMATDPAVIELFSNIPLCDDTGKPKINRFGTILYHDYKEIWELLIYVANASSKNDTISFEDIVNGLKNPIIRKDYDLNPAILKDLLVPNQYNKFTELFTKTNNTFVITDNALVNKLLSGISKPIAIFKNLEMLVENGSFFIKEFVTNSINSTDEKNRRYTDAIAADKTNEYFKVSNSNDIIWNVDKIKELFTNTEGNYSITYQNAVVLLKAMKVLKNGEEVNKNFKEEANNSKKIIQELIAYFTKMFEDKAADTRFKIEMFNISSIHAIIPKNEKKAALSFVTKTFKKMYAAVNLNHQIKMYRRYKQNHLHDIHMGSLRKALERFKNEDPTLLHLPYIKLIELSGQSEFKSLETPLKNILDMSKLSIIDTILEDGEAERVEDLSAETQLKWRLALTNLKYVGNIKKDETKKNINSFTFILPTNSSNKTVKVAEGFEYVTDIKDDKPVYAHEKVSIESTIIANEFNRVISYFNSLVGLSPKETDTTLEATTKTNNIKIYTKNGVFEKALNFFYCVSNQLVEINSTFFITKDSAKDNALYSAMIKDIPTDLYKTLTKLPNLKYFDYNNGKLSLKSDKAVPKLSKIYQKQFKMEIKDLRSSIEKALLVNFTGDKETMSDMVQFIGTDILINTDSKLLTETPKVAQLDTDNITDDASKRYRIYAETYINEEDKTYENDEKKEKAIKSRARVEKQMRELHLLIEAFITAHNNQYEGGAYSTTKGSSLNKFIENLTKVSDEDSFDFNPELLKNQEILLAFNMFQAKFAAENPIEPDRRAFDVEDYGIDERFMTKYITLSDILNLIDKYNRLNKDQKLHVVLGEVNGKQRIVLKHASKKDFTTYGEEIYNKFTSMMYYNTLLNLYDDLNLTVGDMISFYKKDGVTGWGVEATFTNLYKRLKMIISPTVPHAPYVIIPSMNKNEAGKKEFTFNNIVLKSNVTYSPQVRSTMISQNKSISDSTSDKSPVYSAKLLFAIFKDRVDLIEKVNNKTLSLFEANGKLTVKEQDVLDKHFIEIYKKNTKSIDDELKSLGFDRSYFKIDMTDAFDIATLTFELKRAMLYNTNNSVIEQELYNLLYRWLHTPMSEKVDDTVFIGSFNTGVRRLRKHTNYSLEEFEKSLSSIELKKQYTDFIFYLRKDITVDFVRDPYLNNRRIFTDKNSSRVMLPTDIMGSPLNLLRLFMEVYEVDRMSHDSAIKMTSSTIYPIDFWSKIDDFKSEEEAFKFLYGETGGVIDNNTGADTKLINNYVPIKWASIGEQVKQSQSPMSLIASQSKSLVYLNQKNVDYDTLYYNGEQVTVKERKEKKGEETTIIKGIELYEEQQVIWKQIYYSRYREFTDDVFVDGVVNTEKLREFIIDSFQDTDKLKYNDLLSLNTNIFKVEEILKEKINNSEGTEIKATYEGLLATIKEYSSKDINKRKKEELKAILEDLIKYKIITLEDSMKENFLFEYILPLFYNTNSTKIETLFTSMINSLLRIKTTGIKGALTPNVDTVKTSFISEDLKSSMVLVDPNDWTPDLHLRSTTYAEGKIHSDEIATSWNFTGEVSDHFLFDGEDFIPSNDHYGNISRKTVKTETFSIKDLGEKVKTSKNDIIKELDTEFIETMSSTFNGFSPKIHSKMVVHYSDAEHTNIIAVSFVKKEKGILDILDYCKPEKHTLKSSDDKKAISYPVLDLERLPKKILQGFANRIPTQSPNSMSFFKVVAFFHGGTKSTIAAPAEFIVRMGSDFDIDTLYSFIYNFFYDKSDKTFSFSEFTEESDDLFNLWLAKNRLKKSIEDPNLYQLKDTFKATSEKARKEIMKELRVLTGMLKNNENFQSTDITKKDSFDEIVDKVLAYEKEIKAEIKALKDSGDTEGAKRIKRNKLYLYKKHTMLSECIQSLFDEADYLQRKVELKTRFLTEYIANPNMIYELNDEKAVYNRLTDNYISVMSNPRNIESILAPLDFGISEGSGDKTTRENLIKELQLDTLTLGVDTDENKIKNIIDTFNKYGLAQIVSLLKQDESFTYNPLTLLTNYRKYVAASSSKKGVGWAALHQVFTTVVELKGKGVVYIPFESMNDDDIANLTLLLKTFTNVKISIPTDLSMSDINANGKIAGYTGKGQDRSTFVSIFVDDETKQFAAKLNMVAFTFSALAGYNVLGYDFTYYSLLLSNPIIKRLENLKTFYKNRDKTAYLHLFYELGLEENIDKNPSNNFEPYSLIETDDIRTLDDYMHYLYKEIKEDDEFSSDVKDLLLLLNSNDTSELANKKRAGMLLSFYMADKLGKIWGEYAVLMNKDASGISSLYSKVVNQYEDLSELFKNKNVQKLLETFGGVDFLLYSPYLPSKTITTDYSTEHPNPYELIKYIKEYDDIFTTRSIVKLSKPEITGVDITYKTESLKSDMPIKDILELLINYNTKRNWILALKSKTLGNTFLNTLLLIYAEKHGTTYKYEAELIDLIEYLMKPQRFSGIKPISKEFIAELEAKDKENEGKGYKGFKSVYEKLLEYNTYIVNGNILFEATSHKGYALGSIQLAINTYHKYFPYATNLWKEYEKLYRKYEGKSLSYEDAMSNYSKLFKAFQILTNMFTDNNDILIASDKTKGLLMLRALKSVNTIDNPELASKYYFLKDIDISISDKDYVIISYTAANSIVSEAVTDVDKIERYRIMLKDNTPISNTGVTIKELATYLATYYVVANGANYSSRNLGSLIPSTYIQDINTKISFDFDSEDTLSTSQKFDFLLFMFTHDPSLFMSNTINPRNRKDFDNALFEDTVVSKIKYELTEVPKKDLLYSKKDKQLYFNIMSVTKNRGIVKKILDLYYHNDNDVNRQLAVEYILEQIDLEVPPVALYVKLNNFMYNTQGVTIYNMPVSDKKQLLLSTTNKSNTKLNKKTKEKKGLPTMAELQADPYFKPLNIEGKSGGKVKDTAKMKLGNKLISFGEVGSSSDIYATAAKDKKALNPETYTPKDIVNITVNGNTRLTQATTVEKTKEEILRAIKQGVSYFVADQKEYAKDVDRKPFNSGGEGVISDWLLTEVPKLGYIVEYADALQDDTGIYQAGIYRVTRRIEPNTRYAELDETYDLSELQYEEKETLFKIEGVKPDVNGFKRLTEGFSIKQNALTQEEIDYLVRYFGDYSLKYGFIMNRAADANKMFNVGFGWINATEFFKESNSGKFEKGLRKLLNLNSTVSIYENQILKTEYQSRIINEYAIHKSATRSFKPALTYNDKYFYMAYNPVTGELNEPLDSKMIEIMERAFNQPLKGIVDATIGNVYFHNTMIQSHKDTNEPLNGVEVFAMVVANPYSMTVIADKKDANSPVSTTNKYIADIRGKEIFGKKTPTIPLFQGDIYKIGYAKSILEDIVGRHTTHMPHPNGLTGVDNDLDLPEQEGTKNYAMSITVRSLVDAKEVKRIRESFVDKDPSTYTNHSGGAPLSDAQWDIIGREFGVINHRHYREPLQYIDTKGEDAVGSLTLDSMELQQRKIKPTYISQSDYDEGAIKATKAFRMMLKGDENKSVRSAYIIRNWLQVKNADAIFALGTIKFAGETWTDAKKGVVTAKIPMVKGGTGYAVQMAINEGKPVYVFDATKEGWYIYDYNTKNFIPTETPVLTKNYAGIGSRSLSTQEVISESIQAIRDVYEKTFGKPQSKSTTNVDAPAIIGLDVTQRFTRKSVEIDKDYLYLFTDNATRTSGPNTIDAGSWYVGKYGQGKKYPGTTQAVARGLTNAFPITTMVDANKTQWKDDRFDEYKAIIDDEIETIKQALSGYKGIKFGAEMPFGKGKISDMRKAPKIWDYLNKKLAEIGIDNTGDIPKAIAQKTENTSTETGLTLEQEAFAKKNIIEQSFFHGKPYQKADGKWDVYKIKNGIKSSIEGALKGFRTQTTRSVDEQAKLYKIAENQGLPKGTIKGAIVWMEDMGAKPGAKYESPTKGQGGWFRITSEFYSPNREDFNKYENWEDNVWDDRNSEFKIGTKNEWKSVRFEKLPAKSTDTTSTVKNTTFEKEIEILKKLGKSNLEKIVKDKGLNVLYLEDASKSKEDLEKDMQSEYWDEFTYNTFINTVNVAYKLKLENLKIVTEYVIDKNTGKEIEKEYSLPEFIELITPDINAINPAILSSNQLSSFDSNINDDTEITDIEYEDITDKETFVVVNVAQYTYHYYPLSDKVIQIFKNGNPDKDITNDNSKDANKVRVSHALNNRSEYVFKSYNGTEYVKVGNQVISTKTYLPIKDTNILQLFDTDTAQSDIETVEKIPEVDEDIPHTKPKYTFAYKGKEIETHFQLSPDQENVLKQLIDFTLLPVDFKDSKTQRIMVQGAAGVGKTSLIGYLQKYLEESILYTAPTHAATLQLAYATMLTGNRVFPATVPSSLRKDEFSGAYMLSKKAIDKIGFGRIIVVDETSMLNSDDYDKLIKLLSSQSYKIIFVGDKKQIPEVGDKKQIPEVMTGSGVDFKNVSRAFTENTVLNLDTIHRTSNINIKQVLQKTRDSVHFQCYKITKNTDSLAFHKDAVEFKSVVRKLMKAYPLDTDYITYTNAGVRANNKAIREGIFNRKGEIQVGDIVMGYLGYQSKQIEKGHLANSVTYRVEKVTKSSRGYSIELSSDKLDYLRNSGFEELPNIIKTTYVPLSKSDVIYNTMTEEELEDNNMFLSSIFLELYTALNKAKKAVKGTAEYKAAWREYYKIEGEVSDTMAVNDLGDNYIYNFKTNRMELYESDTAKRTKEQKALVSAYGKDISKFVVEKGIDFGHAITIHKSQGRSTKHVLFDGSSVPENRDTIIKENGKQISTERQALSYVGLSRASESLDVLEGNFNYIALPTLEEETANDIVSKLTGDNASFGKNKDC